jgi:RNA polymerase sigma factor (sigma-70 family)
MSETSIEDVLVRLADGDVESAWREFLTRYSPLIMHVVRRYECDHGRATDCYLHACSGLSDDGFRRLLRYRPERGARFQTWLSAVVANLCVDWRRKQHGRLLPVRAVASLGELERLVYRYLYVRGLPRTECLNAVRVRYPEFTIQDLAEINARIFSLLKPQQRWHLSVRSAGFVSLDQTSSRGTDEDPRQAPDDGPGPEELTESEQQRGRLETALTKLPPRQRLMLKLRYQHDLTLEEIARLMRLGDPFRARRHVESALTALRALMTD